ncbi:MAG: PP2C family protein-serine/threonine phosphatase, partial [Butyricimonas faecihominis]
VTSDYDYEEQECYFAPGSQLLLYTDGVSEAQNERSKFYKIDRLFNLVASHSQLAPRQMVEKVVGDVKRFVGKAEQSDDLTVMSFRLNARGKKKTEGLL